jgi:2-haloacid dehalogenase
MKTIEEHEVKNIIFDIGGVLFDYTHEDLSRGFTDESFNPFKPIQEMHETVNLLSSKKDTRGNKVYRLYILSNWVTQSLNLLQRHYPDFLKLFDGIVISQDIGVNKPNPEIYYHLIKKYNLTIHESLFIDDQYANIAAAQTIGIKGIEYR